MITIDDKKIKVSKGDTFNITFNLKGYSLIESDRVIFSVKDRLGNSLPILREEFTGITGSSLNIFISAEKMASLDAGIKYYDLVIVNEDRKYTLIYPSVFEVVEVIHNE